MSHALTLDFEDFATVTELRAGKAVSNQPDFQAKAAPVHKAVAQQSATLKNNSLANGPSF